MSNKRIGAQTIQFETPPIITETFSITGSKEGEGPLAEYYDKILSRDAYSDLTWEAAESAMQADAVNSILQKRGITQSDINCILGGDLLNQCSGTSYGLRDIPIPFIGIYGACSTMALGMSLSAMLVDGGFADRALMLTSSHFCSAEKQFRFPLEYGGQRPQSAQWTVTGAASAIVEKEGNGPKITHVTTGKIVDMGITDANNMGAAMAPAFCSTMLAHFKETGRDPSFYDLIVSGDLGKVGKRMATELLSVEGLDITANYNDCGVMIFDLEKQDVHAGGSGCGCSGVTFAGYIYKEMKKGNLKNVLFCATGALMSPTILQQSESIPGIAHAVAITV